MKPWVSRKAFSFIEDYSYDENGNRLSAKSVYGTSYLYNYDSRNRLVKEIQPNGTTLEYGYDHVGNKTSQTITYINGDIRIESYAYDALNRLVSVTDNTNQTTSFSYDAVGNQTHIYYPNGLVSESEFDALNRVVAITTKDADDVILSRYAYSLDATGRRTGLTEHTGRASTFTYDDVYRLTNESIVDPLNGNYSSAYVYDVTGNRTQSVINGITADYVYDDNDRLTSYTKNGITTSFTYDSQGNQLTQSAGTATHTYTYDREHQLSSYTDGAVSTAYQYNPDGIRINKTVDGTETQFIVDSNQQYAQVIAEQDTSDVIEKEYVFGSDLISQNDSTDTHFYHYDSLGTTRDLSDSTSTISDSYFYEAFGELLNQTGSTDNNYKYTGEQYDAELDNYYLRARYYNQGVGRFTQMDEFQGCGLLPNELNRYTYSEGDPINMIDPTGYVAISLNQVSVANTISNALRTKASTNIGTSLLISLTAITAGDFITRENNLVWNMDQSLSSLESKEKQAERKAYKARCTEPRPPGLKGCELLRWLLKRNQDCKEMRENFAKKWYNDDEPNHVGEIKNLEIAIEKLLRKIDKYCN